MHLALECILFIFCCNWICFVPLSSPLASRYNSLKSVNLVIILIYIPYHIFQVLETNKNMLPQLLTGMKERRRYVYGIIWRKLEHLVFNQNAYGGEKTKGKQIIKG